MATVVRKNIIYVLQLIKFLQLFQQEKEGMSLKEVSRNIN